MGGAPSHEVSTILPSIRFGERNEKEICLVPLTKHFFPNANCSAFQALYRARSQDRVMLTFLNNDPDKKITYVAPQERNAYWDLIISVVDKIIFDTNAELRAAVHKNPSLLRPLPCAILELTVLNTKQQKKSDMGSKSSSSLEEPTTASDNQISDTDEGEGFEFNGKWACVAGFFNLRNTHTNGEWWITGGAYAVHGFGEGVLVKALVLAAKMYVMQCNAAGIFVKTPSAETAEASSQSEPTNKNDKSSDILYVSDYIQHEIRYEFLVTNYSMLRFTTGDLRILLHSASSRLRASQQTSKKRIHLYASSDKLFLEFPKEVVNCALQHVELFLSSTPTPKKAILKQEKPSPQCRQQQPPSSPSAVLSPRSKYKKDQLRLAAELFAVLDAQYRMALKAPITHPQWRLITPKLCLWELDATTQQSMIEKMIACQDCKGLPVVTQLPLLGVVPGFIHCTHSLKSEDRTWMVERAPELLGRTLPSAAANGFPFAHYGAFLDAVTAHIQSTASPTNPNWACLTLRGGFYRIPNALVDRLSHLCFQLRIAKPWFLSHPKVVEQLKEAEATLLRDVIRQSINQGERKMRIRMPLHPMPLPATTPPTQHTSPAVMCEEEMCEEEEEEEGSEEWTDVLLLIRSATTGLQNLSFHEDIGMWDYIKKEASDVTTRTPTVVSSSEVGGITAGSASVDDTHPSTNSFAFQRTETVVAEEATGSALPSAFSDTTVPIVVWGTATANVREATSVSDNFPPPPPVMENDKANKAAVEDCPTSLEPAALLTNTEEDQQQQVEEAPTQHKDANTRTLSASQSSAMTANTSSSVTATTALTPSSSSVVSSTKHPTGFAALREFYFCQPMLTKLREDTENDMLRCVNNPYAPAPPPPLSVSVTNLPPPRPPSPI